MRSMSESEDGIMSLIEGPADEEAPELDDEA
jgi:hypothetical protein